MSGGRGGTGAGAGEGEACGATGTAPEPGEPVAVLVARSGQLPAGGRQAAGVAGGRAVVIGEHAERAARTLRGTRSRWYAETGAGLRPGGLAADLCRLLRDCPLVVLPAGADGRDLAPRLAAALHAPLLANATAVRHDPAAGAVSAELLRLDSRVVLPVRTDAPAVVTLAATAIVAAPTWPADRPEDQKEPARLPIPARVEVPDVQVLAVTDPDPSAMDLADAPVVFAGGAGLAAGLDDDAARAVFELLAAVAAACGASAGGTRVATDAGWIGHHRQIGTTGVTVHPQLYLAFGISGAAQHVGGLDARGQVVSVNLDAASPMTAMADLRLVADARSVLVELADRCLVPVSEALRPASQRQDRRTEPAEASDE